MYVKAEEKRGGTFVCSATEGSRIQGSFFHVSNYCCVVWCIFQLSSGRWHWIHRPALWLHPVPIHARAMLGVWTAHPQGGSFQKWVSAKDKPASFCGCLVSKARWLTCPRISCNDCSKVISFVLTGPSWIKQTCIFRCWWLMMLLKNSRNIWKCHMTHV